MSDDEKTWWIDFRADGEDQTFITADDMAWPGFTAGHALEVYLTHMDPSGAESTTFRVTQCTDPNNMHFFRPVFRGWEINPVIE